MTNERTCELLKNAIDLLQSRVFDNYETEAIDKIGMSKDEYAELYGFEWDDDDEDDDEDEIEYEVCVKNKETYTVWAKSDEEAIVQAIDDFFNDDLFYGEEATEEDCEIVWRGN